MSENIANVLPFWQDCKAEESRITAAIRDIPGQPQDGKTIFITSSPSKRQHPGMLSGVTCLVNLRLGAQRIVEESHRLATSEEIAQFKADAAERAKQIKGESTKTSLVFASARPAAEALKG